MKAALYQGKQSISIVELETPVCGEHDVLLKNLYASICGSDVAVYRHGPGTGHRITVGGEFGHEAVSQVVAVGSKVEGISLGQIVYPYPLLAKGDSSRAGTLGAFSEYILVPGGELDRQLYAISGKIPIRTACLIEPFTIGTRAARRSCPQSGEQAIVFGSGTIGIAAAIALKHFGCVKVMVVDISDFRLKKAQALGFEICNSAKEDLKEKAMSVFGSARGYTGPTANVDIYIDAAGVPSLLDTWQAMGKFECRMVLVAVLADRQPMDLLSLTFSQHALIGSGGYKPEDVRTVMEIMESGRWDIGSIITHEFAQKDLSEAIETASDTEHALNVVIRYDR